MSRILAAALCITVITVALSMGGCNGGDSEKDPTLEDLLAAAVSREDVQELFPEPESWWPSLPEFNVGFDPAPSPIAGERFWVAQSYQQVGQPSNGTVQSALILFEDEAAAVKGFRDLIDINDEGGTAVDGPSVADEWRYFTRSTEEHPYETTLRFREGLVVGRITVFSERRHEEADTLAKYAAPGVERIDELLEGSPVAAALPEGVAELMPSDGAAEAVGPIFASAVVPPESWALVDLSGDPEGVRDRLVELGATELGLRRYGVKADSDQIVEVTLFPLENKKASESWVQEFIAALVPDETMDAGDTGDLSGFTSYDGSTYELQFAKGSVVGDVVCFAPFGETSSACEEPVRKLAELWYSELPAD
jgi:hypothetical protein